MSDVNEGLTSRYAFMLLTMRANTPDGEWLAADHEEVYLDGWRELVEKVGEDNANDYTRLDLLNMANYFLHFLAETSGASKESWLQSLREDYVDPMSDES
ncbi:hypothetical protein [Flexivirga alba]|uniref:Uncharacterized protein n=1 Tax=Flexivirga alba TaxID=702742 RepID=A0ABW2AKT0_9MICO